MTETDKAHVRLHVGILLAGATGIFGRLISLSELPLVWYRVLVAHTADAGDASVCTCVVGGVADESQRIITNYGLQITDYELLNKEIK